MRNKTHHIFVYGLINVKKRKCAFQIHKIYRSSDASVSKAQQEFATTFLRNEHVQTAASNVAATAVRAQMANAANQPRY